MGLGYQHVRKTEGTWGGGQGLPHCAGSQRSILHPTPCSSCCCSVCTDPQSPAQPPLISSLHCPVPPAVSQLGAGTSDFPSTPRYFAFVFHEFCFLFFSLLLQFIKITFLSLSLRDIPASCQLHAQQWVLFSNYSQCKKQCHCHW